MMKIIVIGILYHLLLQNNASGEPTVKVQICSDTFSDAINTSQDQIEQVELKKYIGDFERSFGNSWFKRAITAMITNIPFSRMQFINPKGCKILSTNSLETTFETRIEYGEKSSSQNGKRMSKNSNRYLFLNMEVNVTMTMEVTVETIHFHLQGCTVNLANSESSERNMKDLEESEVRQLRIKHCRIVRKMIENMNVHWKDCLNIDPSGNLKLILKDVRQNPNCLEFYFNLYVDNYEVVSKQKHDVLAGSCISILKEHFTACMTEDFKNVYTTMEDMNIQLSPDELHCMIRDVDEIYYTTVICHIIELTINHERNTLTVRTQCEGFSPESDKSSFEVEFVALIDITYILYDEKVKCQLLLSGDPVILKSESHIGNSGDLDLEYLQIFIAKITNEGLMPAINDSQTDYRIPFENFASELNYKSESLVMRLSTQQAFGQQND